ncbi:MAG: CZB domain-containing protein [Thiohalorhabdus sp.]|uniref:CZB domain-containing protein n=1 Tax=Thiohalorhabdus sp. TaxID=3094134 RepID=UPI0039809B0B
MKKSEVLGRINKARVGHKLWVGYAEALINGIPLDQEKVPLTPAECEFGKWYYGEGRGLADLPAYQKMEEPHDAIHRTYQRIFVTLFQESKPSGLSRLLGTAAAQEAEQKEKARALLPELKEKSAAIMHLLDELEREVSAMDEEELTERMG